MNGKSCQLERERREEGGNLINQVDACLLEILETVRNLEIDKREEEEEEEEEGEGTFVTADIGMFGSKSWNEREELSEQDKASIFNRVQQFVTTELLCNDLTFSQWEDSFVNIAQDRDDQGYIAALQRVIASRADCVVIVGGGNFIKMALGEYLGNHHSLNSR